MLWALRIFRYKELQINPRNAEAMADMALYYAKKGNPTDMLRKATRPKR